MAVPPLPPLAGTSTVLAPAAIAMSAIRDALEAEAPRNLSGHPQNPVSQLLQASRLNFTIARGPLNVTGQPDALVVSTALNGTFQARGTLTGAANALGSTLGNISAPAILASRCRASPARPSINAPTFAAPSPRRVAPDHRPNWRLTPNLAAQVNVVDVVLPIAGVISFPFPMK